MTLSRSLVSGSMRPGGLLGTRGDNPPARCAATDASALRNKQDLIPVGIRECVGLLLPERVGRNDLRLTDPLHDRFDLRWCLEVQDEHRFRVGIGRRMFATGCEFELALSSGNLEKGAVIAIMVLKPTGLMQADQIAVERNDRTEPVGVPSDSNLHIEANPIQRGGTYRLDMDGLRSYLICANAQCGSTLLCRALSDTGTAGHPKEYFIIGPAEALAPGTAFGKEDLFPASTRSRVRGVPPACLSSRGTAQWCLRSQVHVELRGLGQGEVREMPRFSEATTEEILASAFPDLRVIHVIRQHRLRREISWLGAEEGCGRTNPRVPNARPCFNMR